MTNKFHITKNGTVAPCKATSRPCPLGGQEVHFENYEAAEQHLKNKSINEHGILPNVSKLNTKFDKETRDILDKVLINNMEHSILYKKSGNHTILNNYVERSIRKNIENKTSKDFATYEDSNKFLVENIKQGLNEYLKNYVKPTMEEEYELAKEDAEKQLYSVINPEKYNDNNIYSKVEQNTALAYDNLNKLKNKVKTLTDDKEIKEMKSNIIATRKRFQKGTDIMADLSYSKENLDNYEENKKKWIKNVPEFANSKLSKKNKNTDHLRTYLISMTTK